MKNNSFATLTTSIAPAFAQSGAEDFLPLMELGGYPAFFAHPPKPGTPVVQADQVVVQDVISRVASIWGNVMNVLVYTSWSLFRRALNCKLAIE
jgi:hypothetical protein